MDIEWTTERLQRVSLAIDIASAAYKDQDEIAADCPTIQTAFGNTLYARDLAALTTSDQMTAGTDQNATLKDTQAVFGVLQADYSPSGEVELVAGFRGTEFSRLTDGLSSASGIMSILSGNSSLAQSIQTILNQGNDATDLRRGISDLLLTDLDIRRYDLEHNGTSLGYVHKGVYDAIYPYIDWVMGLVFSQIGILNGIEGLRSSEPDTQTQAWNSLSDQWETLTIPKMTITGHSLGAGLATAFAGWIKSLIPGCQIYLYNFASLRIGSPKFASLLEAESTTGAPAAEIIRFANQRDIVTMVPSNLLDEFSTADILQSVTGFGDNPVMHVGRQVTLDWDQVPSSCQDFYSSDTVPDLVSHVSDFLDSTSCWYAQDLLDLHCGYTSLNGTNPMTQWLSEKGYTGSQMCSAGAM